MNTEPGFRAYENSAEAFRDEAKELAGYRTLSGAAVASLLLGLASPVCILGPMFLVVPVASVVAALIAFRQTATSDSPYIGRRAAWIALILSVACGFGTSSYAIVTRQLRLAQASELGRQWVELLLAGDTKQAFRLATGQDVPKPTSKDGGGGPPDPYQTLLERPAVKALLAAGRDADVRNDGTTRYHADWNGEFTIHQWYLIIPHSPSDGGPPPPSFTMLVNLRRIRSPGERQAIWLVADVVLRKKGSVSDPDE